MLDGLEDVDALLGVEQTAPLTTVQPERRADHHGIGERWIDPRERPKLLVRQLQGGRGIGQAGARLDPLEVFLGRLPAQCDLLVIPGGVLDGRPNLRQRGYPFGLQAVETEDVIGDVGLDHRAGRPGLGLECPNAGIGDHQAPELDPGALLDRP